MKLSDRAYVWPTRLNDIYFDGKVDLDVLGQNMRHIDKYMQQQQSTERDVRIAIDEKFEELERRIKDAMSLMHYTLQFYPGVVAEFQLAQKAKKRIGVGDSPVPGVQGT